ncbi:response regulator transcription factor [Listeria booriae]|uniref:Response regulator transcription factor n=1 Tax=Listeria booriae TaxID=1552123 RepID=A0A7X1A3Q1_9LIST|nr:response regulator transcription factor [Listeria booriae]MBC2166549.1 response regulator transcription factor [Listeria booriae]MBC2188584.1 response regulator transcription factor [Listeria booriae]MBC2370713.1 response regulator transcription factor [Listeria booriae]
MIKVLVVDDNSFITGGLEIILGTMDGIEVVGSAGNGAEAVAFCQAQVVDVVLMDVRMPVMDGVEATKQITETTDAKVIILTTFDDDAFILKAIANGAKGYLLKNNDPELIRHAVMSVMRNQSIIQEEIWDKVKQSLGTEKTGVTPDLSGLRLTAREMDVMKAVASGLSNKEIAKNLFISEGTVANNISALLGKLGLDHRTQLAILYLTGKVGGGEM